MFVNFAAQFNPILLCYSHSTVTISVFVHQIFSKCIFLLAAFCFCFSLCAEARTHEPERRKQSDYRAMTKKCVSYIEGVALLDPHLSTL